MRIVPIVLFFLALLTSNLAMAGKSDFDPEVTVQKKEENGKVIFSKSGFAKKTKKTTTTPEVVQPRSNTPTVELYYASWDPYSNKAVDYFRKNRIVVKAYDVDQDHEAAARKKQIAPDFSGLPLVIINGIVIRGVDEKKYQEALGPQIKPPK